MSIGSLWQLMVVSLPQAVKPVKVFLGFSEAVFGCLKNPIKPETRLQSTQIAPELYNNQIYTFRAALSWFSRFVSTSIFGMGSSFLIDYF